MRKITFLKDEEGVTALEYALLATLIALSIIVGSGLIGNGVEWLFNSVSTKVNNAIFP